ncbi:MAG: RNA polymerase sigma factor [Bacteroidales bacterium]|nr:RNA polymerase sigma factor [Bacteroidales bacterium]MDZ4205304.1 RNA polymerase sigma factor [Bacteroidales bacterium]
MAHTDDNAIIAKVLAGETVAFAQLVNRYKDMVFSVARRVTTNTSDAEEVAQDAFLKAFQALPGFKKESKFSTWLYRIATNTAISATRKRKITMASLDETMIENYSEDEVKENLNYLSGEEQSHHVQEAMKQLHSQDVMLVNMFYSDELGIEGISEVTGLSQANVKVRLHRIRKKLYVLLEGMMHNQRIATGH